jgi:hypothetical protein
MSTTAVTPPEAVTPRARGCFGWTFLALVAAGNCLILSAAWQDRSWGALWMAVVGGPILNGVLLISGLVAIPFLKRRRAKFSLGRHLALTLGLPIAAVVADFFVILRMGLHGC